MQMPVKARLIENKSKQCSLNRLVTRRTQVFDQRFFKIVFDLPFNLGINVRISI